jgi:hypothetical protein
VDQREVERQLDDIREIKVERLREEAAAKYWMKQDEKLHREKR